MCIYWNFNNEDIVDNICILYGASSPGLNVFLVNHNHGTLTYNNKYSLDVALYSHNEQ